MFDKSIASRFNVLLHLADRHKIGDFKINEDFIARTRDYKETGNRFSG